MAFTELCITSNFTFLTGGSHAEEYARQAFAFGMPALAVADRNSVSGIARAHVELREIARKAREREDTTLVPRLLPAARIETSEGMSVTALPMDRAAWGRLCRFLTLGKGRVAKGECLLHFEDLLEWGDGMQLLLHPVEPEVDGWLQRAQRLVRRFSGKVSLVMAPCYDGQDRQRFQRQAALAERLGISPVASACPVMHRGSRRRLTDVLTCVREGIQVDQIGRKAQSNAERHMRNEAEMQRLFRGYGDAVHRSGEIAQSCRFSLDELKYEYPSEISVGEMPQERLERLARAGLKWRYPEGRPQKVQGMLEHELTLIGKLSYAPYFLTVHDVVDFARSRNILCQGRGSAANSVVCFALGVTSVSPEIGTMVFERFVSEARNEPPDIDVDFEHERREEVIQYIYERYGRERAGLCATVVHYRGKRAIREVGKAMGLSGDTISALSSQLWGWGSAGMPEQQMREIGLNPEDPRLSQTLELVNQIVGFPRHLSQHVGGFIMTEGRLDELIPIENATMEDRTVICWDKDDIDALGILKVDVLSLGMLTCIRKAFDLIQKHHGTDYALATLPAEDPAIY
ncbi:MAG: error-prone DNA polymerase, partial [Rhodobacteraceae bacterium]|nr:error-prone DNA polymerase [Paracoccaceae bacterium]